MAEFKLQTFVIGLVLFSMLIAAFAIPFGDITSNYGISADVSFNKTYDRMVYFKNVTADIDETVREGGSGVVNALVVAGKSLVAAPKIVMGALGIVREFTDTSGGITQTLNIPPLFITAFITIVTLAIVFGVISLWARWRA